MATLRSILPFRLKADQIYSGRKFMAARKAVNVVFEHRILNDPEQGKIVVFVPNFKNDCSSRHIDKKWMAQRMLELCSANDMPLHYINCLARHNNNNYVLAKSWAEIFNAKHRRSRPIDLRMMELLSTAHDFGRLVTGSADARVMKSSINAAYHGYIGFKIFGIYSDMLLERGNFEAAKMCADFSEICLYHSGFGYTSKDNKELGLGNDSTIIQNTIHNPLYTEMALIALADTKSMYASYPEKKMSYKGSFKLDIDGKSIIPQMDHGSIVFDTVSNSVLQRSRTSSGVGFNKLFDFKDRSSLRIKNLSNKDDSISIYRVGGLKAMLILKRKGQVQIITIENLDTIEIDNQSDQSYTVDIVGYVIASRKEVHRRFDQFDLLKKPRLIDSIFDYTIRLVGAENASLVDGVDHPESEVSLPKK